MAAMVVVVCSLMERCMLAWGEFGIAPPKRLGLDEQQQLGRTYPETVPLFTSAVGKIEFLD